ncbi:MAG: hypothetical protein WA799_08950 [Nitrosotalea sp.]
MTQEISLEQLYQGMEKALQEDIEVPYFDEKGDKIGRVKHAIFFGDEIEVLVYQDHRFIGIKTIKK